MTSFSPAPQTPPENAPGEFPFSPYSARRARLESALQNRLLLTMLLTFVLVGIVARTLWFSRETPYARAVSELYENSQAALRSTKTAYSPTLITDAPPYMSMPLHKQTAVHGATSQLPVLPQQSGKTASPLASQSTPIRPEPIRLSKQGTTSARSASSRFKAAGGLFHKDNTRKEGTRAAADWQALTENKYVRAAEWRRLGIVLALFHRPGALDALAHVDDRFALLPGSTLHAHRKSVSLRDALQRSEQESDPFGHGPVSVSSAQEKETWNALYGPQEIPATQIPTLRQSIEHLRLGWFQNIVLAQLYRKAGMALAAEHAAQAADVSAQQTRKLESLQIALIVFGFVAVSFSGVIAFLRWAGMSRLNLPSLSIKSNSRPAIQHSSTLFPMTALLFAFLIYLVSHTLFGFIVSYLLRPLAGQFQTWSASAVLRIEFALQIGMYVPVFLLPLSLLCKRVPFDPLTGKRMRLRTLMTRLGYHIHNVFAEVGTGAWGYVLLMPGYIIAALVSHTLFHRFHTPVNPAQFETMAAVLPLDKALVFLTAAVAAPIVEETMFRGLLYSALRPRIGVMGAAMLSAAIFALVHPTLPGGFLPIWAIGVALALVYERRGSLLPGMVLHGIHNGLIVFMGFAVFGG